MEETSDDVIWLKPRLGMLSGVALIAGSVISTAIFSPVDMTSRSAGVSLLILVTTGFFAMAGAYCYARLACMIPKNGGDYVYAMNTFGRLPAFVVLWVEGVILRPLVLAKSALMFSFYVFRPFYPGFPFQPPLEEYQHVVAACCIVLLAFINCWDVKWALRVQEVCTSAGLFVLLVVIAGGVVRLCQGHTENFTFNGTEWDFKHISIIFSHLFFYFEGLNRLNFVVGELKDPVRIAPGAIAFSCILVMGILDMTYIAYCTGPSRHYTGALGFVQYCFGDFVKAISWIAALATIAYINGCLVASSRLIHAGACEGQMPELLKMIQISRLTPTPAVIFEAVLSLFYLALGTHHLYFVAFALWLTSASSALCLLVLRWTQPDLSRPVKVNLFVPIIYIIACIFVVVSLAINDPERTGYGCLIISTALPVYLIFIFWKRKPEIIQRGCGGMTAWLQKLLRVAYPGANRDDLLLSAHGRTCCNTRQF